LDGQERNSKLTNQIKDKMKLFCKVLFLITVSLASAQGQVIGVKTNLLYDVTSTVNLGFEVGLAPKWSLELPVNYNPWNLGGDKKIKHWLIQPELRYWLCERFNGHFFGLHGHVAGYNFGGVKLIGLEKHRYEGNLYGAGISYGYQWILNKRWSIEATLGIGYAYLDQTKYFCGKCAEKISDQTKSFFGPTKAGVSLIYIIR
jgi:hypothetical protein